MTSCLVIMQPTFFPWAGYFNLLAQADDFVFLDDVQLEKQSWQTRNRVMIGGIPRWISVPVRHAHLSQTLAETQTMDATHWRDKLARGFALNYGRHSYYSHARDVIDFLLAEPIACLAELNERILRFIALRLQLTACMHRASEMGIVGVRSARLIALCEQFGAKEYLSPLGAAQYLEEDGFAVHSPARLRFQNYVPEPYLQKGSSDFHSHLSILDVIANLGWDFTSEYVRKGITT